ncbi:ORF146 [Saltwater crocodilepox virus]|nr:ORF146 [Saltwater crocodilepox virus]
MTVMTLLVMRPSGSRYSSRISILVHMMPARSLCRYSRMTLRRMFCCTSRFSSPGSSSTSRNSFWLNEDILVLSEIYLKRVFIVFQGKGDDYDVTFHAVEQALLEVLVRDEEVVVDEAGQVRLDALLVRQDLAELLPERVAPVVDAQVVVEELARHLPQNDVDEVGVRRQAVDHGDLLQDGVDAQRLLGLELEVHELLDVEGQRVDLLQLELLERVDFLVEVPVDRGEQVHVDRHLQVDVRELADGTTQDLVVLRERVRDGQEPDVADLLERVALGHDVRREQEHDLVALGVLRRVVHLQQVLERGLHLAGDDGEALDAVVDHLGVGHARAVVVGVAVAEHDVADDEAAVRGVREVDEVLALEPLDGAHEVLELGADVERDQLVAVQEAVVDLQVRVQLLLLVLEQDVEAVDEVELPEHGQRDVGHVFLEHLVAAHLADVDVVALLQRVHRAVHHLGVEEAAPVEDDVRQLLLLQLVVGDLVAEHVLDDLHAGLVEGDLENLLALDDDVVEVDLHVGHEVDDVRQRDGRVGDGRPGEQQERHAVLVLDDGHQLARVVAEDVVRLVDDEDRVLVLGQAVVVDDVVVVVERVEAGGGVDVDVLDDVVRVHEVLGGVDVVVENVQDVDVGHDDKNLFVLGHDQGEDERDDGLSGAHDVEEQDALLFDEDAAHQEVHRRDLVGEKVGDRVHVLPEQLEDAEVHLEPRSSINTYSMYSSQKFVYFLFLEINPSMSEP